VDYRAAVAVPKHPSLLFRRDLVEEEGFDVSLVSQALPPIIRDITSYTTSGLKYGLTASNKRSLQSATIAIGMLNAIITLFMHPLSTREAHLKLVEMKKIYPHLFCDRKMYVKVHEILENCHCNLTVRRLALSYFAPEAMQKRKKEGRQAE
jgi:hypothetical protein